MTTIPELLEHAAESYQDDVALIDETSGRSTYAELAGQARDVTRAALALGVEPGDRVALWAPNSGRWIRTALGLLAAGAVLVPISTRFKGPEAADILARSRCRALFMVRDFLGTDYSRMLAESGVDLPELAHTVLLDDDADWHRFLALRNTIAHNVMPSVEPDAISDILFTSGTTGAPKGAMATHRQTLDVYQRWSDVVTLRRGDRYLLVNPFSHTFGYKAGIIACVLRGVTMLPVPTFDVDEVLRLVHAERISVLLGPPTIFTGLLDHAERAAHDLSSLRVLGTGGTTVPVELVERLRRELAVEQVFTAYGLTESTGVVSVCPPGADARLVAETAGTALPGTEVRIVDADGRDLAAGEQGEILARGPNIMQGYLDDPAATRAAIDADGWLHTGDIGTLDSGGYLRITDRLKDMFIVGGFNAYPAEIERVLSGHPDVSEVAVVGVPDERLGEVGAAYVVSANGTTPDPAAIIAWARERMAGFKVPREVRFVPALPRNASGKVLKHQLRG
ncbi:MAG: AMP-binding protein [Actinophytocola sp.]|nr:AMP-binding protein [Actinophytocola sp.]